MKLERQVARSHARGSSPTKAHLVEPLIRLQTDLAPNAPARQPPLVPMGTPPQVLLLEMEGLLVERFRHSMWTGSPMVHGRPGVVSGLHQLRRRFIICAFCRSPSDVAQRMLSELSARGLRFDLAYALPQSPQRRKASPCLSLGAQEQLYADTGTSGLKSFRRRALLVASLELDNAELECRMREAQQSPDDDGGLSGLECRRSVDVCTKQETAPPSLAISRAASYSSSPDSTRPPAAAYPAEPTKVLCSPSKRRHHVQLLAQDVPTILVPHPRLQVNEQAMLMSEIVRRVEEMYALCATDWVQAFAALPDADDLFKLPTHRLVETGGWSHPSPVHPGLSLQPWQFLVICQHKMPAHLLARYEAWGTLNDHP